MEKEIPIDQLVLVYRRIRDLKEQKKEQYERETGELDTQLETISEQLLAICSEQGVESIRTSVGTVTRTTTTRYWASDWEQMHEFILDNEAPQLLENRIHNGNMKQFLDENPGLVPVGLNATTKYTIRVRKPSNK